MKSCGTDSEFTAPAAELKQRLCLLQQCICLCCDGETTDIGITMGIKHIPFGLEPLT